MHIKVSEVMEWDCRCIRRRLIIICTKYFVIVNYGAATDFRGWDQAPLGETETRGSAFAFGCHKVEYKYAHFGS